MAQVSGMAVSNALVSDIGGVRVRAESNEQSAGVARVSGVAVSNALVSDIGGVRVRVESREERRTGVGLTSKGLVGGGGEKSKWRSLYQGAGGVWHRRSQTSGCRDAAASGGCLAPQAWCLTPKVCRRGVGTRRKTRRMVGGVAEYPPSAGMETGGRTTGALVCHPPFKERRAPSSL
jgi:hypothetical protein